MSEFDDAGNMGKKGFVRDVMRRISASGPRPGDDPDRDPTVTADPVEELQDALRFFGSDSAEFRRRLERLLAEHDAARRRYHVLRQQCGDAERQNEKLVHTLQEAKQQIELLKEEVDKLCAPPNNYGVFTRSNKDGTAEIVVDGRAMRVNVHPKVDASIRIREPEDAPFDRGHRPARESRLGHAGGGRGARGDRVRDDLLVVERQDHG